VFCADYYAVLALPVTSETSRLMSVTFRSFAIVLLYFYLFYAVLQYFLKPLQTLIQSDDLKKIFFGIEVNI